MRIARLTSGPMYQRFPHLRIQLRQKLVECGRISSKRALAALHLDFVSLCIKCGVDFIVVDEDGKHFDIEAVCVWYQDRTERLGNCNSMSSWSNSLTWYGGAAGTRFIRGLPGHPPTPYYQSHPMYRSIISILRQTSSKKTKGKVLIPFRYLLLFIKDGLGIDPDNIQAASYDNLICAGFLVNYWNTMCRPSAIFCSNKTDPESDWLKITGLHWDQIRLLLDKRYRNNSATMIRIPYYKNAPPGELPKDITFGSVLCGKSKDKCVCPYFDSPMYFREIFRRRSELLDHPEWVGNPHPLGPKRLEALATNGRNFVLVTSRGVPFGTSHCTALFKRMMEYLGIDKKVFNITPYCLRVTVTSLAHHQGIDALLIMRYVLWACNAAANPSIHARYIAFTLEQLANVPFQILHGCNTSGNPMNLLWNDKPQMFDVNAKSIAHAMYGGQAKKALAKRGRKK